MNAVAETRSHAMAAPHPTFIRLNCVSHPGPSGTPDPSTRRMEPVAGAVAGSRMKSATIAVSASGNEGDGR